MQPFPELAQAGLELQAAIALRDLPEPARSALEEDGFDITAHTCLVLLGQRGTRLWDVSVRHNLDASDPFDETVRQLVNTWFAEHEPEALFTVVYPGSIRVPLGQLASFVGWGEPSPLGITIHPIHGLWIAHRIAFLCDLDLSTERERVPSPCLTCVDSPCVAACPVDAVSLDQPFDLRTCAEHRAPESSRCGLACHARQACPVSAGLRYGPDQMAHHYASGLASIRQWLSLD